MKKKNSLMKEYDELFIKYLNLDLKDGEEDRKNRDLHYEIGLALSHFVNIRKAKRYGKVKFMRLIFTNKFKLFERIS